MTTPPNPAPAQWMRDAADELYTIVFSVPVHDTPASRESRQLLAAIIAKHAPVAPTPPDAAKLAQEADIDRALTDMCNAFLSWPLPDTVSAAECTTSPGKGRIGTHLLTMPEVYDMLKKVVRPIMKRLLDEAEASAGAWIKGYAKMVSQGVHATARAEKAEADLVVLTRERDAWKVAYESRQPCVIEASERATAARAYADECSGKMIAAAKERDEARATLARAQAYQRAVEEELVVCNLSDTGTPKEQAHRICAWNAEVALDPRVSDRAKKLHDDLERVTKERDEARKAADDATKGLWSEWELERAKVKGKLMSLELFRDEELQRLDEDLAALRAERDRLAKLLEECVPYIEIRHSYQESDCIAGTILDLAKRIRAQLAATPSGSAPVSEGGSK